MDNNIYKSAELIFEATISLQKDLLLFMKGGFKNEEELIEWSQDVSKMKTLLDNVRELTEINYYNNL